MGQGNCATSLQHPLFLPQKQNSAPYSAKIILYSARRGRYNRAIINEGGMYDDRSSNRRHCGGTGRVRLSLLQKGPAYAGNRGNRLRPGPPQAAIKNPRK